MTSAGKSSRIVSRHMDSEPWDLTRVAPQGDGKFGYQAPVMVNPFVGAPRFDQSGGVIYFGNDITRREFNTLMCILRVDMRSGVNSPKDYAVYSSSATDSNSEGYLVQMRVVARMGLRDGFGALLEDEFAQFPAQGVSILEALWVFVEEEREHWGTSFQEDKQAQLLGLFGGNGDSMREELSFGFMVENAPHQVYRIWSRAWLVTK